MINRVVLVGRITRDPELRYSTGNVPYVGFSIAVNRVFTDRNGNRQENTDFINCVVWNKPAENLARFVKKGALLGIEGRLQSRTIEQDGQNRTIMDVYCDSVQFLDNRSNSNNQSDYQPRNDYQPNNGYNQNGGYNQNNGYSQNNYQAQNNQRQQKPAQNDVFNTSNDVSEDDLPF